jgi:hypothetical protein
MADIQTLVGLIPDAQDGDVITADYHNTIKTALEAIAGQLGSGGGGQTLILTLPANFLPVTGSTAWNTSVGFASDSGSSSDGWIPLSFPQDAVLTQLTATGLKTNAAPKGSINLLAVPISGTDPTVLASISLSDVAVGNPFTVTVSAQVVSSLTALLTVDNTQWKYAIEAKLAFSTAAGSVVLYSMQVTYTGP